MKRALTYILAGLLIAGPSATAMAEEKARFESSGFLESLDLFIGEQLAKLRGNHEAAKADSVEDLELSLRDTSDSLDNGFLYLRDSAANDATGDLALTDRPDFSSLLAPGGTVRGSYGQDFFGATSRMGVTFSDDTAKPGDRGFEIALESAYRLSMQGLSATTGFGGHNIDFAERQYNLGLSVGYSGFNLDASIMRQTSMFEKDLSGYGVGFSYMAPSWSARLSLNEYKEGVDLYGLDNEARNILALELGASYRFTERLGVLGGVRYYNYSNRLTLDPATTDNSQMIFLGGRLKF